MSAATALAAASTLIALAAAVDTGAAGAATAPTTTAPTTTATTTTTAPRSVDVCDQQAAAGHVTCFAQRLVVSPKVPAAGTTRRPAFTPATASMPGGYGPTQLQSAYALGAAAASRGAGQRVYIVDAYDDPRAEADLAVYRATFGLPACTTANGCFRKLNQSGTASPLPRPDTGWASEIALDLDMVSAACPRCGITLVEASDTSLGMFLAVQKATALGAKFVSMSWGMTEGSWAPSLDAGYFAASGVVYTAAAGDAGFADGPSYPATSPRVIAVGGTSLHAAANARGWSEQVWRQSNQQGTGSGCSSYEAKPSWQAIVPNSVCAGRAEADVAAVADPRTGVAVYSTYGGQGWAIYGGTSAAAPLIAAIHALAGPAAASTRPAAALYGRSGYFHDVVSGANGACAGSRICTAHTGWDGPTGLGTPNGIGSFAPSAIKVNKVAVHSPGARTTRHGKAVRLRLVVTDSGGARTTAHAAGLPRGLRMSSAAVITGKPAAKAKGRHRVVVTARDATGGVGMVSFWWRVK
ncbi:S8 family serine peptidase [uncultured Jatrophihabitans sp.]|uniref:S53 family peptidase n=1 Tax=uncultured Jatrophihabitans sp. TaxID=1610747 RepID=UPI0035CAF3EC